MDKWRGKVAIVTGASSGIGAAIARELAHHGMTVVGIARRREKMVELAKELSTKPGSGELHAVQTDLRKEEDILAAFNFVNEKFGGADVFVNNAEIACSGGVEDGTVDDWRAVLDVNVLGATVCTKEYLKSLRKEKKEEGHIFMINSVAGHITDATSPMYFASKHALRAISGSLRKRLALEGRKIKVTDICPGGTQSKIVLNSLRKGEETYVGIAILECRDVAVALVDALSASSGTQICEIVLNPVPTKIVLY